jgi:hypothetical protein
MEKDGLNIVAFQMQLLRTIEELTLHTVRQEKQIALLETKVEELSKSKDASGVAN